MPIAAYLGIYSTSLLLFIFFLCQIWRVNMCMISITPETMMATGLQTVASEYHCVIVMWTHLRTG